MCGIRYYTGSDLTFGPSAGYRPSSAGTTEGVFLERAHTGRNNVRPIRIWAEPNEVAGETNRACHAMANSVAHGEWRNAALPTPQEPCDSLSPSDYRAVRVSSAVRPPFHTHTGPPSWLRSCRSRTSSSSRHKHRRLCC